MFLDKSRVQCPKWVAVGAVQSCLSWCWVHIAAATILQAGGECCQGDGAEQQPAGHAVGAQAEQGGLGHCAPGQVPPARCPPGELGGHRSGRPSHPMLSADGYQMHHRSGPFWQVAQGFCQLTVGACLALWHLACCCCPLTVCGLLSYLQPGRDLLHFSHFCGCSACCSDPRMTLLLQCCVLFQRLL